MTAPLPSVLGPAAFEIDTRELARATAALQLFAASLGLKAEEIVAGGLDLACMGVVEHAESHRTYLVPPKAGIDESPRELGGSRTLEGQAAADCQLLAMAFSSAFRNGCIAVAMALKAAQNIGVSVVFQDPCGRQPSNKRFTRLEEEKCNHQPPTYIEANRVQNGNRLRL